MFDTSTHSSSGQDEKRSRRTRTMSTVRKEVTVPKKRSSAKNPEFGAKAAFIRSMPSTMPAKEVVAEAAKQGLKLTEGHVYNLRSGSSKKSMNGSTTLSITNGSAAPAKRGPGRPPKSAAAAPVSQPQHTSQETSLRRAIAELGLTRARAVFAEVEAAFIGR